MGVPSGAWHLGALDSCPTHRSVRLPWVRRRGPTSGRRSGNVWAVPRAHRESRAHSGEGTERHKMWSALSSPAFLASSFAFSVPLVSG